MRETPSRRRAASALTSSRSLRALTLSVGTRPKSNVVECSRAVNKTVVWSSETVIWSYAGNSIQMAGCLRFDILQVSPCSCSLCAALRFDGRDFSPESQGLASVRISGLASRNVRACFLKTVWTCFLLFLVVSMTASRFDGRDFSAEPHGP